VTNDWHCYCSVTAMLKSFQHTFKNHQT